MMHARERMFDRRVEYALLFDEVYFEVAPLVSIRRFAIANEIPHRSSNPWSVGKRPNRAKHSFVVLAVGFGNHRAFDFDPPSF